MTECERIIEKGIVDKDFLKEEVRNDFLVDVNRKKLWLVLIDLYLQFEAVCKKHNLKWFMFYGGILGAIRHGGFIPWDDDIDIVMPRPDYEKFIKLNGEFAHPYFLQTPYSDSEFYYSFTRLRNSNTTAICEKFRYQRMNHGMYIAIFPLDEWELEDTETYDRISELISQNSTYMRLKYPNPNERDLDMISKYEGKDPLWTYEEIRRLSMKYYESKTPYLSIPVLRVYPYAKSVYSRQDFLNQKFVSFEGLDIPIPNGYENILRQIYGNYWEFPPIEKRGNWHTGTYVDPDKPYCFYIEK